MSRIFFLVAWMLVAATVAGGQELSRKDQRDQKEQEIKQLIDSRQFRFVARAVLPMSGPRIDLTSTYDLELDSMMVEAWLPFFGRAYHVEYGGRDGGIKFKEEAEKIDVTYNKRKKIYQINMDVDTDKDNYRVRISAGLSGYADVSISSNNRQSISYYGIIEPLGKKKEQ
ncbi:MAG: DUF4251 domain-containing protein [Prolixibacteraceae bacterium]